MDPVRHRYPLQNAPLWLLLPACVMYAMLAALPIAAIVVMAVSEGATHFTATLQNPLLRHAGRNTLIISVTTTLVTLALALLVAAALWQAAPRQRGILWVLILLPFWTGVLMKNFAWAALLQDNGAINNLLQALGVTAAPITLLHNRFAVVIGMVHYLLPYAVFPIYAAMSAIDSQLPRAASGLGASAATVFRRVILPLSLPGICAAFLLCFIVSTGFYVTPMILGAPSDMMIANLVDYDIHELVDFPAAAAVSLILLLAVVIPISLHYKLPVAGQYAAR